MTWDFGKALSRVEAAETRNFAELGRIAGLDPTRDFRHADLAGMDFSNTDLAGYDFTGSILTDCNFRGSQINDAIFDRSFWKSQELTTADDYEEFLRKVRSAPARNRRKSSQVRMLQRDLIRLEERRSRFIGGRHRNARTDPILALSEYLRLTLVKSDLESARWMTDALSRFTAGKLVEKDRVRFSGRLREIAKELHRTGEPKRSKQIVELADRVIAGRRDAKYNFTDYLRLVAEHHSKDIPGLATFAESYSDNVNDISSQPALRVSLLEIVKQIEKAGDFKAAKVLQREALSSLEHNPLKLIKRITLDS